MRLAGTQSGQRGQMGGCRIALVAVEAVLRMTLVQRQAQPVAVHLGQDRGRRNRLNGGIAPDDGFGGHGQCRDAVSVDEHAMGPQAQALDGPPHREHGRLQDVEAIDLLDARLGNAAAQRLRADLVEEPLAGARGELLGIVEAANRLQLVEHDRGGHHGPSQRAAAGLVDARDQAGRGPDQAELFSWQGWSRSHGWRLARCRGAGSGAAW